jgi:hypothetical protein
MRRDGERIVDEKGRTLILKRGKPGLQNAAGIE